MKPFPFHPLTQTTVLDSSRKPSHGSQEKPLFCQIEHFQKWGVCVSLTKQVLPTGDPVSRTLQVGSDTPSAPLSRTTGGRIARTQPRRVWTQQPSHQFSCSESGWAPAAWGPRNQGRQPHSTF